MTDTENLIEGAKASFDLITRLKGRGLRSGEITLYLDEIAGEELGTAKDVTNPFGFSSGEREQTGVLGEIDKLDKESETYEADLKKLEAKRDKIIKRIQKSGLTFKITAVPPFIAKSHSNEARRKLGHKGKLSDQQQQEVDEVASNLLHADVITDIVDADGASAGKLDYDAAKALTEWLPNAERLRLQYKIIDVQFGDAFDEQVTSDSDF